MMIIMMTYNYLFFFAVVLVVVLLLQKQNGAAGQALHQEQNEQQLLLPTTSSQLQPPHLHGEHFKISVAEEGSFLKVHDNNHNEKNGTTLSYSGYLIDMMDAISQNHRANFTYELLTPSGYGSQCTPRLDMYHDSDHDDAVNHNMAYDKQYRTQYKCGSSDVTDLPHSNHTTTDMYLGMYYVTPERQLQNQFTIPFLPP